jgi:hypothetical protein
MAAFMSEQLELDMKRNQLVIEGKLSRGEADQQAQEWEAVRVILFRLKEPNECGLVHLPVLIYKVYPGAQ